MIIHPKIISFITAVNESGYDFINEQAKALYALRQTEATATEATITLHLGFNFSLEKAEELIANAHLWERESIQEVGYKTFLYMNYNPNDPNFYNNDDKLRFSLL